MNNCTLYPLNNIIPKSEKYFSPISKSSLLNNLAIPNEVFVRKQPHISVLNIELPHKIFYKNSDTCVDDKLCSEFIKLIGEDITPTENKNETKKTKKIKTKTKSVKPKKTKKQKN